LPIVPDFTLDADDGGVAHHQAEYAKHYEDHEYEYEHCALTPLEFSNIDGFRLGFGAGLAGLILSSTPRVAIICANETVLATPEKCRSELMLCVTSKARYRASG
jgi:hypothetical protein